ncbi:hypothetical protein AYO44_04980 [Planctomycetaceae bacterium SCGC AG-212-F19]|nr:hypothetical protein AYO44_04980 [Planctomycetaceae bacterium SCGC AG-212-F19]
MIILQAAPMPPFDEPTTPAISVIVPVFNAGDLLERAIRSVRAQTFAHWELIAVDDASTDDSAARLQALAQEDERIQVIRLPHNQGVGAARNHALREARGEFVTYLDQDDEYYPDYLQRVQDRRTLADVLVFSYDLLEERPGHTGYGQLRTWDPAKLRERLAEQNIAVPLGVAHRRELVETVGEFTEARMVQEDTDLWLRIARAGAAFLFLAEKSGIYHIRADSQSRRHPRALPPPLPDTGAQAPPPSQPVKGRVLFVSWHCCLDPSSGAARSMQDLLALLARRGWATGAFSGPQLDFEYGPPIDRLLREYRLPVDVRPGVQGAVAFNLFHAAAGGVRTTIYQPNNDRRPLQPTRDEGAAFVNLVGEVLDRFRPDLILTYGGDWIAEATIALAKRRGVPVVFWLRNFAYHRAEQFAPVDAVLVPSHFAGEHYRRTLGLQCTVIPGPVDWERVQCLVRGRYVTFVNPRPEKGLFVFARIAEELLQRRPDIPLLVVEGRANVGWLTRAGLDLRALPNVYRMENTADPRRFYAVSRLVLMPSLWNESYGRVPVEACINGIPVIGTGRGALAETLAHAGFVFDVPPQYTPESAVIPTADEVAPWVKTIIRLWDDATFCEQEQLRCRAAAAAWHPDVLLPRFEAFFAPLVARRH